MVITDPHGERQTFPNKHHDPREKSANGYQLILNDLPIGTYLVDFIIPNEDQLFSDTPEKSFVITKGKHTKVQQSFHPLHGSISAKVILPKNLSSASPLY